MELEPGPFGRGIKEGIFNPQRSNLFELGAKHDIASSSCIKGSDISAAAKRRKHFFKVMGIAADALSELMKNIEEEAEEVKKDGCSKVAAKCSLKMMGVQEMGQEEDGIEIQNMSQAMSQAMQDDDVDDPEFIAAVEKVMKVAELRKRWETEGPSFDLGFEVGGRNVSG